MKNVIFSPAQLLEHWQGHRRVTRKTIEKFPEKELFEFSINEMRPFSHMVEELLAISGPGLKSIVNGTEDPYNETLKYTSKEELLKKWDEETQVINEYFNKIPIEKFSETFNLFGQFNYSVIDNILYFIDNEIHHRGQAYVYLRVLNIEPPFFWERD